ncbi:hypothetical protein [Polyangium mundeleinium]|uniref:DUF1080 domain-containing protein n=1 Tax=Polyangium mundeleinium TaxID=2995306 RepID=A0ABT5ENC3_9BACT|nr:hypothetical protein [Polyangium mundeleinium]MDC0742867.1 hypothetical protein [Polyangium mundeleinium]
MASKNLLAFVLAASGALLAPACYLTSSFDGLTGAPEGETASASSAGSGMGGVGGTGGDGGAGGTGGDGGAGGSVNAPATGILDKFDRADGVPGSLWKLRYPGAYTIDGERLQTVGMHPDAALWDEVFGPRQEAYVTIESMDGDETEIELVMRNQGDPSECESVVVSWNRFNAFPAVHVAYCTNGEWTTVDEPIPSVLVEGDTIWARGFEDGHIEAYVNGKLVGTWDVSEAPMGKSGGRIGVYTYGIPDKVRFEDFGGGSF